MDINIGQILQSITGNADSEKIGNVVETAIELFTDNTNDNGEVDTKGIVWDCIEMVAGGSASNAGITEENFGNSVNLISNIIGNAFGANNEITTDDAKAALNEAIGLLKQNGTLTDGNFSKGINAVTSAFTAYLSSSDDSSVGRLASNFVDSISKNETISNLLKENNTDIETVKQSAVTSSTNILSGVFSTGFKLLGNLFTGASDVLTGKSTLKDAASNFLDTSSQDVKNLGNTITSNLGNFFNTAFGGIGKIAGGIFEDIESFVENSGIGNFLKDTVVSFAKSALRNGVKNLPLITNPEAFIAKTLVDTVKDKQFLTSVASNFANDVVAPNSDNETAMALVNVASQYGPQVLSIIQNFAASA